MKTVSTTPDATSIDQAAKILSAGGCVAFPTETVYGLGANARDGNAVAAIYAAKGRPSFNPLIVHVPNIDVAQTIAHFSPEALKIAKMFWPGPLTLVLPLRDDSGISSLVSAGLNTVAIRVPKGDIALNLLTAFDGPIAAPSANPSGQLSPTKAAHVLKGLNGKVDMILDGGDCSVGLESTIIRLIDNKFAVLREGGLDTALIPLEEISEVSNPDRPVAPGQLLSHYAPSVPLRLNANEPHSDEMLLGFGDVANAVLNLSLSGDLNEAAANLFDLLHQLDELATKESGKTIAVSPIPQNGLGAAINDRLQRAAAPRNF